VAELYIGTSGWSYRHWRDCFYQKTTQKAWLKFYAERFNAVEINGSFYRLQKASTFEKWHTETPDSFRFVLKANRYLTHNKKLRDPKDSVLLEKQHALPLAEKLSAILWQLPQSLKKDLDRLNGFIEALKQWPEVDHVIEFRHESWFDDETSEILSASHIASCLSDSASWPLWKHAVGNHVYIRLHGHPETYVSSYSHGELTQWAKTTAEYLQQDRTVHVYFNNDAECAAPFNALTLQALLQHRSWI